MTFAEQLEARIAGDDGLVVRLALLEEMMESRKRRGESARWFSGLRRRSGKIIERARTLRDALMGRNETCP